MNLPSPISEGALAFFQKLLGPVGEATEVLSDKIRLYRWKSSLKTLQRAREIAAQYDLPINEVPLKFLIPFMEKSSLEEEDSELTEQWATLLAMTSANPARARPIFVEILSRLSGIEADLLDKMVSKDHVEEILETAGKSNAEEQFTSVACTKINTGAVLAQREILLDAIGRVCALGPPF